MSAFQDQPAGGNDAVSPLLSGKFRVFFDPVERALTRAPEDGKHGLVPPYIDGVAAPFPSGNLSAINGEDVVQLTAIKRDNRHLGWSTLVKLTCARNRSARLARAKNYWIGIAQRRLLNVLRSNVAWHQVNFKHLPADRGDLQQTAMNFTSWPQCFQYSAVLMGMNADHCPWPGP